MAPKKLSSSTHYPAGRKRAGRRPLRETFAGIGAIEGQVALIVEGHEAEWRTEIYAALRAEGGQEHDHPHDYKQPYKWAVNDQLVIPLMGKVHFVTITATYEAGLRLRYKLAFEDGRWLALTQGQLMKLLTTTVGEIPRTESHGAMHPPILPPVGTTTAAAALPPLNWFGQSKALRRRMFWPVEQ